VTPLNQATHFFFFFSLDREINFSSSSFQNLHFLILNMSKTRRSPRKEPILESKSIDAIVKYIKDKDGRISIPKSNTKPFFTHNPFFLSI
jgi:hypothetical protein